MCIFQLWLLMPDNKQKKPKVPLSGSIRVPEELDTEIDTEATRLRLFKYELVQKMWEVYQAQVSGSLGVSDGTEPTKELAKEKDRIEFEIPESRGILGHIRSLHRAKRHKQIEMLVTLAEMLDIGQVDESGHKSKQRDIKRAPETAREIVSRHLGSEAALSATEGPPEDTKGDGEEGD